MVLNKWCEWRRKKNEIKILELKAISNSRKNQMMKMRTKL